MNAPMTIQKDEWLGSTTAARMLGMDERTLAKAAASVGIRRYRVPGVRGVKYYREDVLKLIRDCLEGDTSSEAHAKNTTGKSSDDHDQKDRTTRTRP